jgi:Ca2+-binding EF-hand superfamily protein
MPASIGEFIMLKFLIMIAALGGSALCASLFAEDDDLFAQLDSNQDGFITEGEVEGNKKTLFERLVRIADENGDKKLGKEEFAKGTQKSAEPKPPLVSEPGRASRSGGIGLPDPKEILSRLDKNGDDKVSKEEAPEWMKENFERWDANNDGKIDVQELTQAAAGLGSRPGGASSGVPVPGGDAKAAEELFAKHDANSDGKLTKDEVPEGQREMFSRIADRVGADSLTKEQFVRAMQTQQRLGGGRPPERRPSEPRPEGRPGFPGGGMPPLPILKALDADGDGEISKEEIENASKALAALDKNSDGKLSRDEILPNFAGGGFPGRPGAEGRPGQPGTAVRFNPEEMVRRLKEADKNSDGKISKEEAPERMKENFDRIDANGDGQLDESELKTMFERMREAAGRRQEGGRPEAGPERKPEEMKE